ncbi:hypothetical protein J1N35_001772 [Gossypium stocksii]|uniref:Uncharacterized protein n=1 Tax=Gossypium stocksii TaxID=47602 RepID=A0A9D3WKP7_9ROSI|nr:hypothetical protein J1N35_001772 [Gossypium stocksii]
MLSGLPEGYYLYCLLRAIGQVIRPVVKLDMHTVSACQGWFVWLAVCVDFRKSLVPKVKINGRMQHVEYESLQNVGFKCGRYGHGLNILMGFAMPSPKNKARTCIEEIRV